MTNCDVHTDIGLAGHDLGPLHETISDQRVRSLLVITIGERWLGHLLPLPLLPVGIDIVQRVGNNVAGLFIFDSNSSDIGVLAPILQVQVDPMSSHGWGGATRTQESRDSITLEGFSNQFIDRVNFRLEERTSLPSHVEVLEDILYSIRIGASIVHRGMSNSSGSGTSSRDTWIHGFSILDETSLSLVGPSHVGDNDSLGIVTAVLDTRSQLLY